jgi:hypothetical protein
VLRQRLALLLALFAAPIVVVLGAMLAGRYYYASPLYEPVAENPTPVVAPQPTVSATGSVPPNDATVPEETTALEETTGFQAPEGTKASSTARVACLRAEQGASSPPPQSTETLNGNSLTVVLTPKVAAHPDGVHIQIDNRLGKSVELNARLSDVVWDVPKGMSNQAALLPLGTAKINCSLPEDFEYNYAYFEIVEGDSGYKSLDLECKPGAEPQRVVGFSDMGMSPNRAGSKFELVSYRDPVEKAREYYKKGLKEGDVVEEAGYPKDPDPPVRVVRNGKVIATYWSSNAAMDATYCDGQIY